LKRLLVLTVVLVMLVMLGVMVSSVSADEANNIATPILFGNGAAGGEVTSNDVVIEPPPFPHVVSTDEVSLNIGGSIITIVVTS
jgi:hypothetical protein